MLPVKNRLKNKVDFQQTYLEGKFHSSGPISIRIKKNNLANNRFGFAVGKNYSNKAVERNRIKRILRSATSRFLTDIKPGFDMVIGIRKHQSSQKLDTKSAVAHLESIFKRNNLLK